MSRNVEVLVVEDSPTQAMLLEDVLVRNGYGVSIARNGPEALSRLEQRLPTFVVSDIVMPGMDGYELCRRIKGDPRTRETPVVLLTQLSGPEDIVRGLECGADNFFTKPYDEQFLLSRLEYILANLELRRSSTSKMGMEIAFGGRKHLINSDRMQILDLLFSTYDTVAQRSEELRIAKEALQDVNRKVEGLHRVALALAKCSTEEEAYRLAVDAAGEVLALSDCVLAVLEGSRWVVRAASGDLAAGVGDEGSFDPDLARESHDASRTCIGAGPGAVGGGEAHEHGLASMLSAPIGRIGVFQAASLAPDAFSPEDAHLLELLLAHAAEALGRIGLQIQLKEQAIRDPLTGLYNRYYLDQVLERETKRSKRYGHPIAFLMADLNKFKEINDRHGHLAGDLALKTVASLLSGQVREVDIVIRYGGDEFLIVLPEAPEEAAAAVRSRILKELGKANSQTRRLECPVTLSIGVAYWRPEGSRSVEETLAEADQRMYEDKRVSAGD